MGKQCEICGVFFYPLNIKKKCCSQACYRKFYLNKHNERIKAGIIENLRLTTGRWSQLKNRVKNKGFTHLIPKDKYMAIIKQPCYYCGTITYGIEKGIGLDRLDPSKEYTEDNVVSCCGPCNRSKSDVHTPEKFKAMLQVDKYIDVLKKLNKAQKVERTLDDFIDYLNDKY